MQPIDIQKAETCTGLSRSMLTYLAHQQIVRPSETGSPKRGRRRLYSFADLILLRAIARLLEQGIEVKRLRRPLQKLQVEFNSQQEFATAIKYLVTDGVDVFTVQGEDAIANALTGQLAFAFLLDVRQLNDEVTNRKKTPPELRRRRPRGVARAA
jgi:DNA-binding transcriptional MerR regulator